MPEQWRDTATQGLARGLSRGIVGLLGSIPESVCTMLSHVGGGLLNHSKGKLARASIKSALPQSGPKRVEEIARKAAWYSTQYIFSLARLSHTRYQLHDMDVIEKAMSEGRGLVIISLHIGPPDLGTLALTRQGVSVKTLIGAGKQKPWLHLLGTRALSKAGVSFLKRGDPTAVIQSLKQRNAVVLYSDMRSREVPVTFFGHRTSAPASGLYAAMIRKAPVVFHYCTLKGNCWHLHFESFELKEKGRRREDVGHNLQKLIHRMEEVIREHPELWIWHYDRFKLKKRI